MTTTATINSVSIGETTPLACPPHGNLALRFLAMLNPKQGFALDMAGRLLRTTDGGNEWQATGAAVTPSLSPAVAVVQPNTVVITGQHNAREVVLFASVASGSVHQVALPTTVQSVSSVSFLNSRAGWIMANVVGAMGSEGFDLFQTTNGGTTWTRIASANPYETAPGQPPFGGDKSGISFRNLSVGWLTGSYNTLGTYFFFRTGDGGRTWRSQSLALPPGYQYDRPQLRTDPPQWFGTQAGILPITILANPPALIFYTTHDGGSTWLPTIPIRSSAVNSRFPWSFEDAQHGWVTNGSLIWKTSDGGLHWIVIQPTINLSAVHRLEFVNTEQGWVVLSGVDCHNGQVLKTIDGGRTWTTLIAHLTS
ncbi:MAG: hypothetical protein M1396_02310 [Chloroflexi bacterium]|nr:hypothetical protein [Chloroflexota bacterium]